MVPQKFYKEDGTWYINCPECKALGVPKTDLAMHVTAYEWFKWMLDDNDRITKMTIGFSPIEFEDSRPLYRSDRITHQEAVYFFAATDYFKDHWAIILSDYFKFDKEWVKIIYYKLLSHE